MSRKEVVTDFFGDLRQHLDDGYLVHDSGHHHLCACSWCSARFQVAQQGMMTDLSTYAQMMIVPIMTVFIAFSIAGKLAIAPGFVIALMADQMGMGFLGGLIVALLIGYSDQIDCHAGEQNRRWTGD